MATKYDFLKKGVTLAGGSADSPGWVGEKGVAASGRRTRNQDYFTEKWLRVKPEGVRLDNFLNNPIFLYRHRSENPEDILGETHIALEGGRLVHTPTFHLLTERSRLVSEYWKRKIGGTSIRIGFTDEDIANIYEDGSELVIPTSELVEASYAPIMADPGAHNREVLQVALSLGYTPQRAAEILEVNMEEDTVLEEGIVEGVEEQPFFSPEDEVALAVALTENEQAYHILRDKLLAEMQADLDGLRDEIAQLRGEPVRRSLVDGPRRMFSTTRQFEATPPATIRGPQRNGAASASPKQKAASFHVRRNR